MAVSQCRQKYHEESEARINKIINAKLYASYEYMAIAHYFDQDHVALQGSHKYFKEASDEKRKDAQKLMKYQNQRGGQLKFQDIKKPKHDEWGTLHHVFEVTLNQEKKLNEHLLELHSFADSQNDPQLCDFLDSNFLTVQVETMKEIVDHITNLKHVGTGLGERLYDQETLMGDD